MDQLAAMRVFIAVAEENGFAPAARRLGLSTSAVSRHVADLEAHFSAALLHRTTRRLRLTEAGARLLPRAAALMEELGAIEEEVRDLSATPKGRLRISASPTFGDYVLAPIAAEFVRAYPEIKFELELSHRLVDVVAEGFDAVLRAGPPRGSDLMSRRIAEARYTLCASPAYLASAPPLKRPEDLTRHSCIHWVYYDAPARWRFADGPEWIEVDIGGRFVAASSIAEREAARRGLGVALLSPVLIEEDLKAGRLVEVLPEFPAKPFAITMLWPNGRSTPLKLRVFIDFLTQALHKLDGVNAPALSRSWVQESERELDGTGR